MNKEKKKKGVHEHPTPTEPKPGKNKKKQCTSAKSGDGKTEPALIKEGAIIRDGIIATIDTGYTLNIKQSEELKKNLLALFTTDELVEELKKRDGVYHRRVLKGSGQGRSRDKTIIVIPKED